MATTAQDVIKKFMASLDKTNLSGTSALDEAIKACSNSKFTSISSVINQMVADCKKTNNATNFLKNYCDIDLTNTDTGAITGLDAGGSKTAKTAESIVPESGSLSSFTGNSFTTNGLTFKLGTVNENNAFSNHYSSINFSSLNTNQKFIWQGLYTWWGKEALNLIADSYGNNFGFDSNSSATIKTMHVGFYSSANDYALAYVLPWTSGKTTTDLDLKINMYYYRNLITSNLNGYDSVSKQTYLDRLIAHEFTHAVMAANINYFAALPQIIQEGMAELTHGIDNERTATIKSLAGDSAQLKNALSLTARDSTTEKPYAAGYMLLRYIAKQFADSTEIVSGPFTEGADNYTNNTASTILSALGGNDTILNYATKVTINGDAGNDVVTNYSGGTYAVINGGAGNDDLGNRGNANVTMDGGEGNDYLANSGNNVTLSGGTGNDTISSCATRVKMFGGAGDDRIYSNYSNYSTVYGGAGNDFINCNSENQYSNGIAPMIFGDEGNDTINCMGMNGTITGGTGNDMISLTGSYTVNSLIKYASGDGNDTVYGFNADDTLEVTGAKYSTVKSGNDLVVKVGSGSVTLKDAATLSANIKGTLDSGSSSIFTEGADYYKNTTANTVLSALGGNDTVENYASNVKIYGNAGSDDFYNSAGNANVTLDGGAGNDFFFNNGDSVLISGGDAGDNIQNVVTYESGSSPRYTDKVTIDGGAGNDYIWHWGNKSLIDGGAGNDSIRSGGTSNNGGNNLTIKGGAGNDTIIADGKNSFINGGTDDDRISLTSSASSNVIQYASGDGNDTVYGFKTSDTLNITGAKYSTVKSGNDLVVKVGSGSITLKDAATLSANIKGTLESSSIFTENADSYENKTANTVLSALGGNDSVLNTSAATNVTIYGNGGNDTIKNSASNVKIFGNDGDDSLDNANGAGNVMGGNNVTLNGGDGKDALFNNGSNVLLMGGAGNDNIQNLITYVSSVAKYADKVTIDGGKGDDFISINEYSRNTVIKYADGDGNDRVFGFDSDDTLNITSGSISKTSVSGSDFIIYVGDGSINLKGVVGSTLTVKLADGKVTTLKASAEEEKPAWRIIGTSATYGLAEKTPQIILSGVNPNAKASDFSLNGKTVTLSKGALINLYTVKISDGYTLALGSDVTKSKTTSAAWTVSKGTATYKSASNTAGYRLSSDQKEIYYDAVTSSRVLTKITGLSTSATSSDLSLNGKTVTLSKNALGTTRASITGGYTLALGSDVTKSKTTAAGFTVSGTTAAYKSEKISAGYTLADDKKSVSYTKASGGKTLVTLSGLKSGTKASKLSLKNKTVTLASGIIGSAGASVEGGGYTFALKGSGKLTNVGEAAILKGSSKKDTLIGGTGADTLNGGNGADYLSGGKGNDSVLGGSGADTLIGGAGNDTLVGGKGKDVFVFAKSSGNDVITDYTAGTDKIKISSGSIGNATVNGKDVVFTIGNGSITVKNGKGKKITVVDANGKTTTKKYSSSSKTLALLAEDNFVTADNLSSIVQKDLAISADKIENQNFDSLTQKNNLITYADK